MTLPFPPVRLRATRAVREALGRDLRLALRLAMVAYGRAGRVDIACAQIRVRDRDYAVSCLQSDGGDLIVTIEPGHPALRGRVITEAALSAAHVARRPRRRR